MYIYIYMHAVVFENGVLFLRLMRSKMLPFKRSIMGCAESGPRNAYFYSVSGGGPGPLILAGAQNIGRRLWGTMPKMRLSKANCHSLHMASSSAVDRV